MMDKNREAFEAWWVENCTASSPKGSSFGQPAKIIAFDAWQASRQAIEVELPERCNGRTPETAAYDDAIDECAEAITSLGIRVKGNEE